MIKFRTSIRLLTALVSSAFLTSCAADSWERDYHLRCWESYRLAAEELSLKGLYGEAQEKYLQAANEAKLLQEPSSYHLSVTLVDLGRLYLDSKDLVSARLALQDALTSIASARTEKDSVTARLLSQYKAMAIADLGDVSFAEMDLDHAREQYMQSLSMLSEWRLKDGVGFQDNLLGQLAARINYNLGQVSLRQDHVDQSRAYFEQAISIARCSGGPHRLINQIIENYGKVLSDLGESDKASGLNASKLWVQYTMQADACFKRGAFDKAVELHNKALLEARKPGQPKSNEAMTLKSLAEIYCERHQYPDAISASISGLAIADGPSGGNNLIAEGLLSKLINCYCAIGDRRQAIDAVNRLLAVRQRTLVANHIKIGECYVYLASLYQDQGNLKEAKLYSRKALDIFAQGGGKLRKIVGALEQFAGVLLEQGQLDDAASTIDTALKFCSGSSNNKSAIYRTRLHWRMWELAELRGDRVAASEIFKSAQDETAQLNPAQKRNVLQTLREMQQLFARRNMSGELKEVQAAAASIVPVAE